METPEMYGWFHLTWLAILAAAIVPICVFRKKISPKAINITLIVWGVVMIIIESIKLVLYSFHYDNGVVSWAFDWGRFPFQFCSTPLYVALPAGILKKGKVRDFLLCYLALFSLFAGLISMFMPSGMFADFIFISLHTMLWHGSMVVIGIMLLVTGSVKIEIRSYLKGLAIFMIMLSIALILNLCLGHHQWFNMFYISPYEVTPLEVFNIIYEKTHYIVFLLCYIVGFSLAAFLVYLAAWGIKALSKVIAKKRTE